MSFGAKIIKKPDKMINIADSHQPEKKKLQWTNYKF